VDFKAEVITGSKERKLYGGEVDRKENFKRWGEYAMYVSIFIITL
jgi:hypothetical protein